MSATPSRDKNNEREVIEFGIASFADELDSSTLSFPIGMDSLIEELGDPAIPIDAAGHTIPLSSALEETPSHEFESEQEVLNELHPVLESHRRHISDGVLGSIRAFLPF